MTEVQQKQTLGIAVGSLILGCFFFVPLLGILFSIAALILGIIAVTKISKNQETLKGQGMAIAGIVLGAVGIVLIPIIALLAAIAIPNLLMARMAANEAGARATVQMVSTAIETYAVGHNGEYPPDESALREYLPERMPSVDGTRVQGYVYSLELGGNDYIIQAEPVECGSTARSIITKRSDGEIAVEGCR